MIESVVRCRTNADLIAYVAPLWIGDDPVVDVTYGRGNFWKKFTPSKLTAHDLHTVDGVDFRCLPYDNNSLPVVVFDPPYVSPGGRDKSTIADFNGRFGLHTTPRTPAELQVMIRDGIDECARVLARKGRLLVKCMDYVNGGRLILGRHAIVQDALENGLRCEDEFIHHSGVGPQPPRQRQFHSRRAHSYLLVFVKP